MASFADRLRSLRNKHGLTQKQIADRLGITESAYGFYEQGKREPSQTSLVTLSEIFDVPIDYLLRGAVSRNINGEVSDEEREFIDWVSEVDEAFFYDFHKSPEEQKKQFLETMRALWEVEKKRGNIK